MLVSVANPAEKTKTWDDYKAIFIKKKRIRDGKCLINGLLILKWKYWAQSIKKAIDNDEINKSSLYQIPKISIVANEIFNAPTNLIDSQLFDELSSYPLQHAF